MFFLKFILCNFRAKTLWLRYGFGRDELAEASMPAQM